MRDALRFLVLAPVVWWLAVVVGSCRYANTPAHWPAQGPFVQVDNYYTFSVRVIAVDGVGRRWPLGNVPPARRGCWRWPFIATHGWIVAGRDSVAFEPWSKRGWRYIPALRTLEETGGWCR